MPEGVRSFFAPLTGVPLREIRADARRALDLQTAIGRARLLPELRNAAQLPLPAAPRISVSIGSLDEPEKVEPQSQYGIEGSRMSWFAALPTATGDDTEDDSPELRAEDRRLQSPASRP